MTPGQLNRSLRRHGMVYTTMHEMAPLFQVARWLAYMPKHGLSVLRQVENEHQTLAQADTERMRCYTRTNQATIISGP